MYGEARRNIDILYQILHHHGYSILILHQPKNIALSRYKRTDILTVANNPHTGLSNGDNIIKTLKITSNFRLYSDVKYFRVNMKYKKTDIWIFNCIRPYFKY